ncbi:hypothetical protein CAPTEDRAFT_226322 [Capitella teleta]|uniref:Corticotropin-releasing factor domain-containing protein n=1 Tax=Capitella teleta TaxID=283909 RepID=R7UXN9_CAPTE|nr:hypothetical protein CAPTEDRAFT_226322 [Capitella teleta]|eukprot:ELU08166.1 hypothetical protein CAPTEDRAFT_226322 [Capitella teleta]
MPSILNQAWCVLWVVTIVVTVTVHSLPRVPLLGDHLEYQVRDTAQPKPEIRNNGLGSLLLKNLRFRDLGARDLAHLLNAVRHSEQLSADEVDEETDNNALLQGEMNKRSTVSVSQLAALLHNLRSRDLDEEGVKLQSLRFGK